MYADETDGGVELKTNTEEMLTHCTRMIRQPSSALQSASNATAMPVHRANTVSHSRDEATCLQQEAVGHTQQQKVSSNVGHPNKCEDFTAQMQPDINLMRREDFTESSFSTDAVKLSSSWGTDLAHSVDGLFSDSMNSRWKAVSESTTFVVTPSRHVSSANSNVLNYLPGDVSSSFNRSEREPAGHSVHGGWQSCTASDRELPINSGRKQTWDVKDRLQCGTDAGNVHDEQDVSSGDMFWRADVTKCERFRGSSTLPGASCLQCESKTIPP